MVEDVVLVGSKRFGAYVKAIKFKISQTKFVFVCARGKNIPKLISMVTYLEKDGVLKIKETKISRTPLQIEEKQINVPEIKVRITKE